MLTLASNELHEELSEKSQEELAAMVIANGLLPAVAAASASKDELIALLMEAADNPLPERAFREHGEAI